MTSDLESARISPSSQLKDVMGVPHPIGPIESELTGAGIQPHAMEHNLLYNPTRFRECVSCGYVCPLDAHT